ncbi:FAD-dependent monooxygenase [Hyphobacterium sp. CCMP332]|nr:FAD-dependent monooxygenase [Hyphobacterium sp. CCMP332]
MTIDIIGAGIAGLTSAIALNQNGFKVNVFEQADRIKPLGAGIILANNAMQVFDKLGLKNQIEQAGNVISFIKITDSQLKPISIVDLNHFEQKYKVKNIAIHRGILQEILLNNIPVESLKTGYELIDVKQNDTLKLRFNNKKEHNSELLLAADGINSIVRNQLFSENTIRWTNQICWRGIAEFNLSKKFKNELNEAWGKGDRIGFVQIQDNKVYWYALKTFKQNPDEYAKEQLALYFVKYHPLVKTLIENTPTESIHKSIISDLKPVKKWFKNNVCLIGDAAHATSPNMGQGACQGVEDAFVLANCLKHNQSEKAFFEYQKIRQAKAHFIVNISRTMGKMAHFENEMAIWCRNLFLKTSPEFLKRKQSEKIFEIKSI